MSSLLFRPRARVSSSPSRMAKKSSLSRERDLAAGRSAAWTCRKRLWDMYTAPTNHTQEEYASLRRILARGRNGREQAGRRRRSRFQLRNRVQCRNHTGRLISSSDVSTGDRRFCRCAQILQPSSHVVVVATCCLMIYSLPPCVFGGRVVAKKPCTVSARRMMCRLGQGRLTEDGKRGCCRSDR